MVLNNETSTQAREYARQVGDGIARRVETLVEALGLEAMPEPNVIVERVGDLLVDPDGENEIAQRLAPFWSAEKVRAELGNISREAVASRRRSGGLLGCKTVDGKIFYPVVQFERFAGQVRLKPGLLPFLRALRGHDPWTVALLMHTPAAELGGLSPLDWVRQDKRSEDLAGFARAVGAVWDR